MNKKTRSILIMIIVFAFCLALFVSCANNKINFFDYSDDNLGLIGKLVKLMHQGWIKNYGWTVVVFTVFLKLIMLPLDFWQRYSTKKSSVKMQKIQPLIESIDKRYGANTQRANEEKQKLYKKQGYSMVSTCLPMIISMVVFFVMFAGLRNYSTYSTITTFQVLSNEYYDTYAAELQKQGGDVWSAYKVKYDEAYQAKYGEYEVKLEGDAVVSDKDKDYCDLYAKISGISAAINADTAACEQAESVAFNAIKIAYTGGVNEDGTQIEGIRESWLWIQNVWQPDTWDSIMPEYDSGANSFTASIDMSGYPADMGKSTYNTIRQAILESGVRGDAGKWNGLMILPILSIGLSFLSMFISQLMEKKNKNGEAIQQNQQQQATNKTMMILMPLMMAYFGFIYTGAFAIYMVVNYLISILSTVALRWPVEKLVEKNIAKGDKDGKSSKASYMR
ncbi:MAG: membrane protein insertase YidC [Corallococcus sp.]|nr:membrane protein insertase YidC [Bacillota bacterium]MCM1533194.1 membrane protein insertase YidC [Corallococcus sp.]